MKLATDIGGAFTDLVYLDEGAGEGNGWVSAGRLSCKLCANGSLVRSN